MSAKHCTPDGCQVGNTRYIRLPPKETGGKHCHVNKSISLQDYDCDDQHKSIELPPIAVAQDNVRIVFDAGEHHRCADEIDVNLHLKSQHMNGPNMRVHAHRPKIQAKRQKINVEVIEPTCTSEKPIVRFNVQKGHMHYKPGKIDVVYDQHCPVELPEPEICVKYVKCGDKKHTKNHTKKTTK